MMQTVKQSVIDCENRSWDWHIKLRAHLREAIRLVRLVENIDEGHCMCCERCDWHEFCLICWLESLDHTDTTFPDLYQGIREAMGHVRVLDIWCDMPYPTRGAGADPSWRPLLKIEDEIRAKMH